MASMHADVVIVGAGSVGMSVFLALAQQNRRVILLEQGHILLANQAAQLDRWDARNYAVSLANYEWLCTLGLKSELDMHGTAMQSMHVVYEAGKAFFELSAHQLRQPFLAWMIRHDALNAVLAKRLGNQAISWSEYLADTVPSVWTDVVLTDLMVSSDFVKVSFNRMGETHSITAQCIVGADGAHSWVREAIGGKMDAKPYSHEAIIGCFETEYPHDGMAYQWMKKNGEILAWLPMPNGVGVVWSRGRDNSYSSRSFIEYPDQLADELSRCLEKHGKRRLGYWRYQGGAAVFPLSFSHLTSRLPSRVVLMGDARHRVHPLSGQGMNLGLLEARQFVAALKKFPLKDLGHEWLAAYRAGQESWRQHMLPHGIDLLWKLNQPDILPPFMQRAIGKGWSFFHQSAMLKRVAAWHGIK